VGLTRSDIMYDLPVELIAQEPPASRRDSRLMVIERASRTITHSIFSSLPSFLRPGDLLVLNDTGVRKARLTGIRPDTGGKAEALLLEEMGGGTWKAMLKPGRRSRKGATLDFGHGLEAVVAEVLSPGRVLLRFGTSGCALEEALAEAGEVPLPPYIRRKAGPLDEVRYQTVYASHPGAVAAPTAGLHFDGEMLRTLEDGGVREACLTLHVGPGTFEPLRHDEIDRNELEAERYVFPGPCASAVQSARASGGRIVAVGTTSARVLETAGDGGPSAGWTSLFIRPPYEFRAVDALITNFHLPGSSLLCLVGAFAGLELMRQAYEAAIAERYRFYSYGDAMLIL